MAAVGGAAMAGSALGIADMVMTDAAAEAMDATMAFLKMKKKGRDNCLQLI
jgi:hypothetical protein